jgi:predicted pyridoxine 5'-phosphate oxidase superfamily flavin-nucleotide-binding protein
MSEVTSDVAFTAAVKLVQEKKGSRRGFAQLEASGGFATKIGPQLANYIANLDMFYLGTANAVGQPYIQYRGGPRGFLKVIDDRTLAFADFSGNRQYITLGNLSENPRAFLFLMDYVRSRRVKVWGTARVVEDDPELLSRLVEPGYRARPERAIVFAVEAWDANCPQHIHPRLRETHVNRIIAGLQERIDELQLALEEARAGRA